jgi:hypothetical protein
MYHNYIISYSLEADAANTFVSYDMNTEGKGKVVPVL